MGELCQAQAGDQGQQAAIGNGACIVGRIGLAAKRKCDRLGARVACQVIHGVPGGGHGYRQHEGEWQSCDQRG